jgi:UDP-N-acetylglucosamine 4,6-dehydratase
MKILIIGGTGSLGKSILAKLCARSMSNLDIIRVISRDEHKQAALKRQFPKVDFRLADIRDFESIRPHFHNIDVVFHCAALKHVDICQFNPLECKRTNVDGTINAIAAAKDSRVKHFIFSSTDKAIDPINTYGKAKALAEDLVLSSNNPDVQGTTKFCVYRWGNVVGSQGSVIPLFVKSLRERGEVDITHPEMTRFWLTLDSAVDFMLSTYMKADRDRAMVIPNLAAAPVTDVVRVLANLMRVMYRTNIVGMRPGEKLHESLVPVSSDQHVNSLICRQLGEEELSELLRPLVAEFDRM